MNQSQFVFATTAACALSATAVQAQTAAIPAAKPAAQAAAAPVTPYVDARYRIEVVDQAGLPETATASTLRVRAGIKAGEWQGFSGLIEGEAIAVIGSTTYNDTINGKTTYPVVADPSDFLLNQAWLRWRPDPRFEVTGGRQAVNYDNQRWIGSVGWRQNDQTLDAVRVAAKPVGALTVDYMHAWRVNRVFGTDSPQGIWRGNKIDAVRVGYTIKNVGTISAYGYWLDIPSSPASSSRTFGVRIAGEHSLGGGASLLYSAEYARQEDFGANPAHFDLDYWQFEPGVKYGPLTVRGGYESLEGNGTVALQTPLATLHAFNGWADKFLTTPVRGLRDLYIDAGYKIGGKGPLKGLALRAQWHDFNSTIGALNYGQEWDASASYPVGKHFNLTAKLARYNAQSFATDTTKVWLQIEAKF